MVFKASVTLNVGGTEFTTFHSTLSAVPGCKLPDMIANHDNYDEVAIHNGNVFIDRDPELFQLCLNFLRDPKGPHMCTVSQQGPLFTRELEFYGLRDAMMGEEPEELRKVTDHLESWETDPTKKLSPDKAKSFLYWNRLGGDPAVYVDKNVEVYGLVAALLLTIAYAMIQSPPGKTAQLLQLFTT